MDHIHFGEHQEMIPLIQSRSDGYLGVIGTSADALAQYADIPGVTQGGTWRRKW